jgi:hypothetical protein
MKKILFWSFLYVIVLSAHVPAVTETQKDVSKMVAIEVSTNKTNYSPGEKVKISIKATNNSKEEISTYYSSSQKYDLVITDKNGKEMWRWSHGKMFLMAIYPFRLKPKESVQFNYTWDQRDNSGKLLLPGKYSITGELAIAPRIRSQERAIKIIKAKSR